MSTKTGSTHDYQCDTYGHIPVQAMKRGDTLWSPKRRYRLSFQHDGDVVIYSQLGQRPIYSSKAQWLGAQALCLAPGTGNVSLKRGHRSVELWHAHGHMTQFDGEPLWPLFDDNGRIRFGLSTAKAGSTGYVPPGQPQSKSFLCRDEVMPTSSHPLLVSRNGRYELDYKPETDALVLRRRFGDLAEYWTFNGTNFGATYRLLSFIGGEFHPINASSPIDALGEDGVPYSTNVTLSHRRHADYLELLDSGVLVARAKNGTLAWASDRFRLSFDDPVVATVGSPFYDRLGQATNKMLKGQSIVSEDGLYEFQFRTDGNAVLRRTTDDLVIYETGTRVSGDGELLLTDTGCIRIEEVAAGSRKKIFEVASRDVKQGQLSINRRGQLLYHAEHKGKPEGPPHWGVPTVGLRGGEYLEKGQRLVSGDLRYRLCFEQDGNVRLYRNLDDLVLFETGTRFTGYGRFILQSHDGNLVVYRGTGDSDAAWGANAHRQGYDMVRLSMHGKLEFSRPADDVSKPDFRASLEFPPSRLLSAQELRGDNKLTSPNGRFVLLKAKGNGVALLDGLTGEVKYDSQAARSGQLRLGINKDKLVVLDASGETPHRWIEVTDRGDLEICYPDGDVFLLPDDNHIWSGQTPLSVGTLLTSSNRQFDLLIRHDGFELLRRVDEGVLFSARRPNRGQGSGTLSRDENNDLVFKKGEEILWRAGNRVPWTHLEVTDWGSFNLVAGKAVVWSSKRIACIAWGSLVWDPRSLPMIGQWHVDGPMLMVDFKRQSRDGRITLVLSKQARPVQALWVQMNARNLPAAVADLALREGIPHDKANALVGSWSRGDQAPEEIPDLAMWAWTHGIDHVVWTNLGPKMNHAPEGHEPDEAEILSYLKVLVEEDHKHHKSHARDTKRFLAEQYIRRTPPQIATALRERIEQELGWTFDPYF